MRYWAYAYASICVRILMIVERSEPSHASNGLSDRAIAHQCTAPDRSQKSPENLPRKPIHGLQIDWGQAGRLQRQLPSRRNVISVFKSPKISSCVKPLASSCSM
jgi:hypothetical protein